MPRGVITTAVCAFMVFICFSPGVLAAGHELRAVKAEGGITVDGDLNDAGWRKAEHVTFDTDGKGQKCAATTDVAVAYDNDNIYVSFVCRHPRDVKISAQKRERDGSVWNDDSVELFLDPGLSRRQFYQLAVNAEGSLYDSFVPGVGHDDAGRDLDVKSAVKKADDQWVLEMAIPVTDLTLPSAVGPDWGINFCRTYIPPAGDAILLNWAGLVGGNAQPDKFGILRGVDLGGRKGACIAFPEHGIVYGDGKLPVKITGLNGAATAVVCVAVMDKAGKEISQTRNGFGLSAAGDVLKIPYRVDSSEGKMDISVTVADWPSSNIMATVRRRIKFENLSAELREIQLGPWIVQGTAEARADGEIILKDQDGAVEQSVCITNLARRRFVCALNCRGGEENIPLWISFFYRDAADQKVREIRAFEHAQTLTSPTSYKEEIAFPESAGTLEKIRIARGKHNGMVSIGNLTITAAPLAYLFFPRFSFIKDAPTMEKRFLAGPTRPPAEGAAEINFLSPRVALAVDVPVPLYFELRGAQASNVQEKIFFDLPPEITDLYVMTLNYNGKPVKTGQTTVDGITYNRYTAPIFPVKDPSEGAAKGFIIARAGGLPGRTFRIGYFLEWDGVAQPERWLEVDAISIPDGPALKKFMVAALPRGPRESLPGFVELWRRSGINAVEVQGNFDQNSLKIFRDNGMRIISSFCPGHDGGYQGRVQSDPDMQGKGVDGKTVMLEHGRPAACPSYRGEFYRNQLDRFRRDYVKATQPDIINHDDEYFVGNANYCFCDRCKSLFKDYMTKNHPTLAEIDPVEIFKNAAQYPEHKQAWIQFKADLWTEWYRDYRRVADEELAKINPKGKVEMYTTCGFPGQIDKDKEYVLRDYATLLGEDIVQRAVPQLYLYAGHYQGVPRGIGDELMELQKKLGPYRKGERAFYPYLLGGLGCFSCILYPPEVLKYEVLEACTAGAINGFILYPTVGTDAYHWKYLAEALHMVAKVEDILWDGKVDVLPCSLSSTHARVIRKEDEAVLFVTEYGYDPVEVPVVLPVNKKCLVTDVETGELVAKIEPDAKPFIVRIDKERARLLKVMPQP